MKIQYIIAVVAVAAVFVGVGVPIRAEGPWSAPIEIARDQGSRWVDHPKLKADQDSIWSVFESYPGVMVGYSRDGEVWSVMRWWPGEGFFVEPKPLDTFDDQSGRAIHFVAPYFSDWSGIEQRLYGFLTVFGDGRPFGGCFFPTDLPYEASHRYDVTSSRGDYHLVWRNSPNGFPIYARGEDRTFEWTEPVTITKNLSAGTVPAIWAEDQRVVILADDYAWHQSWALTSKNGGDTWSEYLVGEGVLPQIAESGPNLVAVVQSPSYERLFSYVSGDCGESWEGPYGIPWSGSGPDPEEEIGHHAVAADPESDTLAVVWHGDKAIYTSISHNGGRVWNSPEVVYDGGDKNRRPDVTFWNGKIYVVWKGLSIYPGPDRILISNRVVPPFRLYLPIIFNIN